MWILSVLVAVLSTCALFLIMTSNGRPPTHVVLIEMVLSVHVVGVAILNTALTHEFDWIIVGLGTLSAVTMFYYWYDRSQAALLTAYLVYGCLCAHSVVEMSAPGGYRRKVASRTSSVTIFSS